MPGTLNVTRVTIEFESGGKQHKLTFDAPKLPNSILFNPDEAERVHPGGASAETGAGAVARTSSSQRGSPKYPGSAAFMVIHDPDCEWWSVDD